MTSMDFPYRTTFSEDDLFDDVEPLNISDQGNNDNGLIIDGFDFVLEDSAHMLADSKVVSDELESVVDLNRMFEEEADKNDDSNIMVMEYEESTSIQPPVPTKIFVPDKIEMCQPVTTEPQQQPTTAMKIHTGYNCVRSRSRRGSINNGESSPDPTKQPRVIHVPTKIVNLDPIVASPGPQEPPKVVAAMAQKIVPSTKKRKHPAPYNHRKYQKEVKRDIRRSSYNDIDSMMIGGGGPSSNVGYNNNSDRPQRRFTINGMCPNLSQLFGHQMQQRSFDNSSPLVQHHQHHPSLSALLGHSSPSTQEGPTESTPQYAEGVLKLAASMKRTELSRRQLLMQHTFTSPTSTSPTAVHVMHGQVGQLQQLPFASQQNQQENMSLHSAQAQLQQRVADSGFARRSTYAPFETSPFNVPTGGVPTSNGSTSPHHPISGYYPSAGSSCFIDPQEHVMAQFFPGQEVL